MYLENTDKQHRSTRLFGGPVIILGGALELFVGHYIPTTALASLGLFCFPFNKTLLIAFAASTQDMVTGSAVSVNLGISTRPGMLGGYKRE